MKTYVYPHNQSLVNGWRKYHVIIKDLESQMFGKIGLRL